MEIAEHLAQLRRDGDALVATASAVPADSPVPTCPGWDLRTLVGHMGRVQRWASSHVIEARQRPMRVRELYELHPVPPDDQLADWLSAGLDGLINALAAAPNDLECWHFLPAPTAVAFWARRQAHETAIHRADAQSISGSIDGYPAAFAVDGIDELLLAFFARPDDQLVSDPPRRLRVSASDAGVDWLVTIGPTGPETLRIADAPAGFDDPADATMRGAATDVYLALWNRPAVGTLSIDGDEGLLGFWREHARILWSE